MRVLHVLPRWETGGATRSVSELLDALRQFPELECVLLVLDGEPSELRETTLSRDKVRLHKGKNTAAQILAIRSAVKAVAPDIIHSHLWPAALRVAMGFPLGGRRHLVHIRDTPPSFLSSRWTQRTVTRMLRTLFRSSRPRFVSVSASAADYAITNLGLERCRVSVVRNGIDPVRLSGVQRRPQAIDGAFVFGAAGRYVPEKGFHLLIEAFSKVRALNPKVRLCLVGAGSMQSKYEQMSRELQLTDCVEIRGYDADMRQFYGSIDAYVCASLSSEGMSRALIEAMMVGLPVVSTKAPGCGEIIADGESGFMVPLGDATALAAAMNSIAWNHDICMRLGDTARTYATTTLTLQRVAGEIHALYQSICANRE